MQTAANETPYNPVVARNIPLEMANVCAERGLGMTRPDLLAEGFTDEQINKHSPEAARILRSRAA
jgi:aryl-alcohol dehydrogenase-like predicted oxidoreductase